MNRFTSGCRASPIHLQLVETVLSQQTFTVEKKRKVVILFKLIKTGVIISAMQSQVKNKRGRNRTKKLEFSLVDNQSSVDLSPSFLFWSHSLVVLLPVP